MKSFLLGTLVAPLVLVIGALCYMTFGLTEIRGIVAPSSVETTIMRAAVRASVRRNAPEVSNPIEPTDPNLIQGGKQYLNECSGCHGAPSAPVKHPGQLNPPAPQFGVDGTDYTESQIFWVAKHGIRWTGMSCNRYWDSDEELWKMAAFIKHMKVLSPSLTEKILN